MKLIISMCLLSTSGVYDLIYYTVYIGTLAATLCQVRVTYIFYKAIYRYTVL